MSVIANCASFERTIVLKQNSQVDFWYPDYIPKPRGIPSFAPVDGRVNSVAIIFDIGG